MIDWRGETGCDGFIGRENLWYIKDYPARRPSRRWVLVSSLGFRVRQGFQTIEEAKFAAERQWGDFLERTQLLGAWASDRPAAVAEGFSTDPRGAS